MGVAMMSEAAILEGCPVEGLQLDLHVMQKGQSDPIVPELALIVESLVRP